MNIQQIRAHEDGNGEDKSLTPRGVQGSTTGQDANEGGQTLEGGPQGDDAWILEGMHGPAPASRRHKRPSPTLGAGIQDPALRTVSADSSVQCAQLQQPDLNENRPVPGSPMGAQYAPEQRNAGEIHPLTPNGPRLATRERTDRGRAPPPRGTKHKARKAARSKKTLKAAITVASINIRGFGSENAYSPNNKWMHVNQLMRDKRIGILVVQETHMDEKRRQQVEDLFQRRIRIFATWDPDNPTGKGG